MGHHRIVMTWMGDRTETLEDIVKPGLRMLFVGYNPSLVSLSQGHYHRGTLGRQLWKMLETWRIVPEPAPGAFHDDMLLPLNIGITDLVKRATPRASFITPQEISHGGKRLDAMVHELHPSLICTVYKTTLDPILGKGYAKGRFGLLPNMSLHGAGVFALPFPYRSGSVIKYYMAELNELLASQKTLLVD